MRSGFTHHEQDQISYSYSPMHKDDLLPPHRPSANREEDGAPVIYLDLKPTFPLIA